MVLKRKTKYIPKLASGEWFGAYCLTEPGAGSDPTQEKRKPFYPKTESIIRLPDKKCGSLMQVSVLCLSYLLVLEMIKITGFIIENDADNGISMGEEEHKLGIRASSTRQVFFNETKKVSVENMLSEREMVLK
jgi:alkylation response protein AidB-like acyl-CoA dehydrogenase